MSETYDTQRIKSMERFERANFVNALSGYKSANLIGTISKDGDANLSLISSVFHLGANPPLMGMIMRPHTVRRDTLQNIKDTGVYTINHVNSNIVEQAHQCSANYESKVSEFEETGLIRQFAGGFKAPFVEQSHIKIALEVREIQVLQINLTELVIGEVVQVITDADYSLEDGYIDIEAADSSAVSGLDSYHSGNRIDRYAYAKADTPLRSIWK